MHPSSQKEMSVELRRKGYTYTYISERLGIPKSTLSMWLSGIKYVPNDHTISSLGKSRAAAAERKAVIKQNSMQREKEKAANEVGDMSNRDLLLFGLGLYLGEGAKTGDITRISNADPRIMNAAIAWFRMLGVQDDQFAPRIHLYPDSDVAQCLQFWSKTISIPVPQFHSCYIDARKDKKSGRQGKLPYGTLHVMVRSNGRKEFGVEFFRRIQMLNEVVLEQIAGVV